MGAACGRVVQIHSGAGRNGTGILIWAALGTKNKKRNPSGSVIREGFLLWWCVGWVMVDRICVEVELEVELELD